MSGIPYNVISLAHGNPYNPGWTGVENVILVLSRTFPADGLLPIYINPQRGTISYSTITFGAMGDSFYEYLLKVWIQGNRTASVNHYREMWETSMKGLSSLVKRTTPSSFAYICEKIGNSLTDKVDELACFAPGMLSEVPVTG